MSADNSSMMPGSIPIIVKEQKRAHHLTSMLQSKDLKLLIHILYSRNYLNLEGTLVVNFLVSKNTTIGSDTNILLHMQLYQNGGYFLPFFILKQVCGLVSINDCQTSWLRMHLLKTPRYDLFFMYRAEILVLFCLNLQILNYIFECSREIKSYGGLICRFEWIDLFLMFAVKLQVAVRNIIHVADELYFWNFVSNAL